MSTETDGLLEYLSQPSQIERLTPAFLERVCIRQAKQAPNITMPTMGGKNFWDSLEVNGWKIQRNKISGHYRILDPENQRRAYGSERDLNLCFEYCFMEAQQYQSSTLNERSIVSSGEKGLLEYLSRPDRLALLTSDLLECICQKQSNRALNIPTSTMGGKNFWDSLGIGGWKIQRNRISGHCRVLDAEGQRRAYGSENELKFYFECYLSEEQQHRRSNPNKYGIVLSGGGGKGAFEVGVWRYLNEQKYDRLLNGVSGASVGALNSLLLVNGDLEKAERLWSTVTQTDMLPLNLGIISTFFTFIPFGTLPLAANFAASQMVSHLKPKKDIPLKSGGSGIMSQWGLAQLIDQSIDWTRVQHSGMTAFCSLSDSALFSKSDNSGDWLDVLRAGEQSEYICWSNMEPQLIKELVLASASLPVIYGSKKVRGHDFHDGGIQDNVPIRPLISMGYSEIIVVHLLKPGPEADKEWERSTRGLDLSGVHIYHVYPENDFQDNIAAMLTVDSKICKIRMEQGYRAAKNQLDKLPW